MDLYGASANDYDRYYGGPVEQTENRVLFDGLRQHLDGKDVLDLGAGTGLVADYCRPRRYTAVDISNPMLNVLHSKHPEAETWFADLDSASIQLPDRQYDTAVAIFSAYWFHLPALLTALNSRLHPGGVVILHGVTPRRLKRPSADLGAVDPILWTDRVSAFTPTRVHAVLSAAGYTEVRMQGFNAVPDWISRRFGPFSYPAMTASKMLPAHRHWHFAAIGRTPR